MLFGEHLRRQEQEVNTRLALRHEEVAKAEATLREQRAEVVRRMTEMARAGQASAKVNKSDSAARQDAEAMRAQLGMIRQELVGRDSIIATLRVRLEQLEREAAAREGRSNRIAKTFSRSATNSASAWRSWKSVARTSEKRPARRSCRRPESGRSSPVTGPSSNACWTTSASSSSWLPSPAAAMTSGAGGAAATGLLLNPSVRKVNGPPRGGAPHAEQSPRRQPNGRFRRPPRRRRD